MEQMLKLLAIMANALSNGRSNYHTEAQIAGEDCFSHDIRE
jgi:hypothetical protein